MSGQLSIGIVGLGRMGRGIAGSLLRKGFGLTVFDIDASRMDPLVEAGATRAADIRALSADCDTILLSLPSSHVTVEVLECSLAPHLRRGSVVIDTGTTIIHETRRLHALLADRGVALVDAPVSGGSEGASRGALYVFAGGDREVAESRWKVLEAFGGARVTYCGGPGCGQIAKAVNQLAMGLVDAAFIEAAAFGVNAGVNAAVLAEAVGGDEGFRAHFRHIARLISEGAGDANDVKYAEHRYFLDESERKGFPSPMLEALYAFMSRFPETARDNMERPYPPLWSALTGDGSAED